MEQISYIEELAKAIEYAKPMTYDKEAFNFSDEERKKRHKLVEILSDNIYALEFLVESNPKYFFHVTDLYCVSDIMTKGLYSGNDNCIWIYSDFFTTDAICEMCSKKKYLYQRENHGERYWRNYFECGYGVIAICKEMIPDAVRENLKPFHCRKDIGALRLTYLQPEALSFVGAWNMSNKVIEKIDFTIYDKWKKRYLAWLNTNVLTLDSCEWERHKNEIEVAQFALRQLPQYC